MLTKLVTPTSHMSKTRPSNIRTNVSPSGLFLVSWPITNRLASFFDAQKSSEAASSNGCISFFLEKEIAFGRFKAICNSYRKHKGSIKD